MEESTMQYVAFLGGLNVGGHRVKMEALRTRFEALGYTSVSTFLASGSVIFVADEDNVDARDIERQIEKDLAAALGYDVPAFVRSAEEVRTIAAYAPFTEELLSASAGKLQVALLRDAPDAKVHEQVLRLATDADRLAIMQRELVWLPSGRMSDSQLDLVAIYTLLGQATMRTMNTIARIAARYLPAAGS
jgi:uncharacterized protein (DUF1697 family)